MEQRGALRRLGAVLQYLFVAMGFTKLEEHALERWRNDTFPQGSRLEGTQWM
jgi:hypothetical protein